MLDFFIYVRDPTSSTGHRRQVRRDCDGSYADRLAKMAAIEAWGTARPALVDSGVYVYRPFFREPRNRSGLRPGELVVLSGWQGFIKDFAGPSFTSRTPICTIRDALSGKRTGQCAPLDLRPYEPCRLEEDLEFTARGLDIEWRPTVLALERDYPRSVAGRLIRTLRAATERYVSLDPQYRCLPSVNRMPRRSERVPAWWSEDQDKALLDVLANYLGCWSLYAEEHLRPTISTENVATVKHYRDLERIALLRLSSPQMRRWVPNDYQSVCAICGRRFWVSSLPPTWFRRLGQSSRSFCPPCLSARLFPDPRNTTPRVAVQYVADLAKLIGTVPTSDFGSQFSDYGPYPLATVREVIRRQPLRPSQRTIKKCGGWESLLGRAMLLPHRRARGYTVVGSDGHVCDSLGEQAICNFLTSHGVRHTREPRYPGRTWIADFGVGNVFIEYFGLAGQPGYDSKTRAKLKYAQSTALDLIAIYPADLARPGRLAELLGPLVRRRVLRRGH
jgi:hypothetical protein